MTVVSQICLVDLPRPGDDEEGARDQEQKPDLAEDSVGMRARQARCCPSWRPPAFGASSIPPRTAVKDRAGHGKESWPAKMALGNSRQGRWPR